MTVPILIRMDRESTLDLVRNRLASKRSKHIDVLHPFVRERAAKVEETLEYCSIEKMLADYLTKVVSVKTLHLLAVTCSNHSLSIATTQSSMANCCSYSITVFWAV
jgi:hypothetical protein